MRILASLWQAVPLSETAKTYIEGFAVGLLGLAILEAVFHALAWYAGVTL